MGLGQRKIWATILPAFFIHAACGSHQSKPKATRIVVQYTDLSISEVQFVNERGQGLSSLDLGQEKYGTGCTAIGCGVSFMTEEFFFAAFSMMRLAKLVLVRETGLQELQAARLDWKSYGPGEYGDFEYEVSYWVHLDF